MLLHDRGGSEQLLKRGFVKSNLGLRVGKRLRHAVENSTNQTLSTNCKAIGLPNNQHKFCKSLILRNAIGADWFQNTSSVRGIGSRMQDIATLRSLFYPHSNLGHPHSCGLALPIY
jgi:hypothetical protein